MSIYVMFTNFRQTGVNASAMNDEHALNVYERLEDVGAKVIKQYEHVANHDLVDMIEITDSRIVGELENFFNISNMVESIKLKGPYQQVQYHC